MGYEPDYEPSFNTKTFIIFTSQQVRRATGSINSANPCLSLGSIPVGGRTRQATTLPEPALAKAVWCLELPPRLLNEANKVNNVNNNMPSPNTVLDGPYFGHQSLSRSKPLSFWYETTSFSSLER